MSAAGVSMLIPVTNGWIAPSPAQHALIRNYLQTREGKAVAVKFERPKSPRSRSQNSYMWAVPLTIIAESTGHTTEEVHGFLKEMFLPRKFIKIGSREVQTVKSTTDLTTEEFELYLQQIRTWAETELSLRIPLPNE